MKCARSWVEKRMQNKPCRVHRPAWSTSFLVKLFYVYHVAPPWTQFDFQLNPGGSVFGQRLTPSVGFKGTQPQQVTFQQKCNLKGVCEEERAFHQTRLRKIHQPPVAFSITWDPSLVAFETKHGRPCLPKNRPPAIALLFKGRQAMGLTTKIKKYGKDPWTPSRQTIKVCFPFPSLFFPNHAFSQTHYSKKNVRQKQEHSNFFSSLSSRSSTINVRERKSHLFYVYYYVGSYGSLSQMIPPLPYEEKQRKKETYFIIIGSYGSRWNDSPIPLKDGFVFYY